MVDEKEKQLKELRRRFRDLSSEQREKLGVAMLKVNLGVNSDEEYVMVQEFLKEIPLEVKQGKLDTLMSFLHAETSFQVPDISGWIDKTALTNSGEKENKNLSSYSEDELDTLKEPVLPLPKTKT